MSNKVASKERGRQGKIEYYRFPVRYADVASAQIVVPFQTSIRPRSRCGLHPFSKTGFYASAWPGRSRVERERLTSAATQ